MESPRLAGAMGGASGAGRAGVAGEAAGRMERPRRGGWRVDNGTFRSRSIQLSAGLDGVSHSSWSDEEHQLWCSWL
eukprot:14177627-Alexandrium_andersonii.AAC.1